MRSKSNPDVESIANTLRNPPPAGQSGENGEDMKFKKVPNIFMFSKYVREDGKYTITAEDRKNNRGTYISVFVVTDENGIEIDVLPRLKKAKEKYADM